MGTMKGASPRNNAIHKRDGVYVDRISRQRPCPARDSQSQADLIQPTTSYIPSQNRSRFDNHIDRTIYLSIIPLLPSAPSKSCHILTHLPTQNTMSQSQDKSVLDVEKAQPAPSSDTASIFSTSSFGSAKALLKKHIPGKSSSKPDSSSSSSGSGSGSSPSPTQAELDRIAQRNQIRMNF
ncbi:hypothetical protein F4811DRAFT_35655 [Daldinia bambusicola]|nr:hypothetical protein F4811DRAFT_35655 [Daldinia bambusicola]